MRLIHRQQEAMPPFQLNQAMEIGKIAIHAKQAVCYHQLANPCIQGIQISNGRKSVTFLYNPVPLAMLQQHQQAAGTWLAARKQRFKVSHVVVAVHME